MSELIKHAKSGEVGAVDAKPLVIEAGKRYVLRNGDVTDEIFTTKGPIFTRCDGRRLWKENGQNFDSGTSSFDIIAEYVEAPPAPQSDVLREEVTALAEKMRVLTKENARLREALIWYRDQVRDCRLITRDGVRAREVLDTDGGKRASAALSQQANKEQSE